MLVSVGASILALLLVFSLSRKGQMFDFLDFWILLVLSFHCLNRVLSVNEFVGVDST